MSKISTCENYLSLENILRLSQATFGVDKTPAIYVSYKIYSAEIGRQMRLAHLTVEQYLRRISEAGENGTLKINIAVVTGISANTIHSCRSNKTQRNILDDLFCVCTDGSIALKIGYLAGNE